MRHYSENDPFEMPIAYRQRNIYNGDQILPEGIYYLSKFFYHGLAMARVLSLGPKFIPNWKFEKE